MNSSVLKGYEATYPIGSHTHTHDFKLFESTKIKFNRKKFNTFQLIAEKSGRDIKLTCPNTHHQSYCQWQREFSPYQFEDLTKRNRYINQDKILMKIQQFSYVDGGRYRCKCYNADKIYRYSHSITIGKYI